MIEPVRIDPEAIYDDGSLMQDFGLTSSAMAKARRSGALRHATIGNRVLYRGVWLIGWLERIAHPGPGQ